MTTTTTANDQLDVRDYLRPVWQRRWLVLAIVVIVTTLTYVYYDSRPRQYRSSTTVYVKTSQLEAAVYGTSTQTTNDRNVADQARLLKTPAVAADVARTLRKEGYAGALLGQVDAVPVKDSDFVTITAQAGTTTGAAALANAFAASFISIRSTELRKEASDARDVAKQQLDRLPRGLATAAQRADLQGQVERLDVVQRLPAGAAEQIDKALPQAAFAPTPARNALFAFVLSLVAGIAIAYGLGRMDRRLSRLEDIQRAYDSPILAVLPSVKGGPDTDDGIATLDPSFREPLRSLRVGIELATIDDPARSLLVTSAVSGEGKTTVARNLALVYAEAGYDVVLIEGDLRRPTLAHLLPVPGRPGLTDHLAGQASLEEALKPVALVAPGDADEAPDPHHRGLGGTLHVLPAGPEPPNPPGLLASQNFAQLIARMRERFDIVIFDSPPVLTVADALSVMAYVDATIVVARSSSTTRDAAHRTMDVLGRVPAVNVVGVVVNAAAGNMVADRYGYYPYVPASGPVKSGR